MKKLRRKHSKLAPSIKKIDNALSQIVKIIKDLDEELDIGINDRPCRSNTPEIFNPHFYMIKNMLPDIESFRVSSAKTLARIGRLEPSGYKEYPYKEINERGYVELWSTDLERMRPEHRHVVEISLGRRLDTFEYIHHINGNKLDNSLENLKIVSPGEHNKIHREAKKKKESS